MCVLPLAHPAGNMYIGAFSASQVVKVRPWLHRQRGMGLPVGARIPAHSCIVVLALCPLCVQVFPNGTVVLFAGTGQNGYTGDNGPAVSAQLGAPTALAWHGPTNSLLVAEGHRVRAINASGIIRKVIGSSSGAYAGDGGCVL